MVVISEMGFAGIFAKGPLEADRMRVTTMRDQMPLLAARDWIAGAILWCYQDYKSPRNLWPGMSEGYVEHGVVDEARQRKPSYQVWKKLTEPATITAQWVSPPNQPPTGFALLVAPNSERSLPYYPLHDYRLIWSVVDESGKSRGGGERRFALLIDAVPVTGTLQPGEGHTLRLNVELQSPTGLPVADEVLEWPHSVATQ
jgi:beta-glucuronidase